MYKNSEFQSIHLKGCRPFYLKKQSNEIVLTPLNVTGVAAFGGNMYFPREEMRNVELFVEKEPTALQGITLLLEGINKCRSKNKKIIQSSKKEEVKEKYNSINKIFKKIKQVEQKSQAMKENQTEAKEMRDEIKEAIDHLRQRKRDLDKSIAGEWERDLLDKIISSNAPKSEQAKQDAKEVAPQPPS